jgi:hypothetical protein
VNGEKPVEEVFEKIMSFLQWAKPIKLLPCAKVASDLPSFAMH